MPSVLTILKPGDIFVTALALLDTNGPHHLDVGQPHHDFFH
ncbi:MAG: hypothetical protein RLZZ573_2359, partial [Pseudomonadota bacterium]